MGELKERTWWRCGTDNFMGKLKHQRSQCKTNYFMDHFKFKLEKNSLLTKMDLQSADSITPLTDHQVYQAYLIGYSGRRCSTIGRLVEV